MNQLLRIFAIAALVSAGLVANAQAGERGPKAKVGGPRPGKPMGPMAELGLTPEQKQSFDRIHEAAAKQAEPVHQELAAKMKEMQALFAVDKPDRAAIERKHAEMSAIHAKLWGIHLDAKLQIHAVLTPEQRAKWAQGPDMPGMMHGPGMGGMHGPGMGGMRGGMHGDCPCKQGGECPCKQGGECPCMRGAGGPPKPEKK
jgi:Spy/CpxP family protein refolding chaperone